MMRSTQVQSLARAGFEIGGHTVTHPILLKLDPGQAQREIRDGKAQLEALLGRPLRLFAYPNGRSGEGYGAETITIDDESREALENYMDRQLHNWMESHW